MPNPTMAPGPQVVMTQGGGQPTPPPDFVNLALTMLNAKKQKEAGERAESEAAIREALKLAKEGFPIDAKSVEKHAKRLGIDFQQIVDQTKQPTVKAGESNLPGAEEAAGATAKPTTGTQPAPLNPQDIASLGNAIGGSKQGAQSAFPISENAAAKNPGGGVVGPIQDSGQLQGQVAQGNELQYNNGVVHPAQAMESVQSVLSGMAMDAQMKSNMEREFTKLQQSALTNDRDLGRLMLVGAAAGRPINMEAFAWTQGTPESRGRAIEIAHGAETPHQFNTRKESIRQHVFSQYGALGISPQELSQVTDALASGRSIPPELAAKMSKEMNGVKGAETFYKLAPVIGTEQARKVSDAVAAGIPLTAALPSNLVGMAEKLLKLEERKTAATEAHAAAATSSAATNAKEMDLRMQSLALKAMSEQDEKLMTNWNNLIAMKKNGFDIPDDVVEQATDRMAERFGFKPEETRGIWNYMTFGMIPTTNKEYRPQAGVDPKFVGTKPAEPPKAFGTENIIPNLKDHAKSLQEFFSGAEAQKELERKKKETPGGSW